MRNNELSPTNPLRDPFSSPHELRAKGVRPFTVIGQAGSGKRVVVLEKMAEIQEVVALSFQRGDVQTVATSKIPCTDKHNRSMWGVVTDNIELVEIIRDTLLKYNYRENSPNTQSKKAAEQMLKSLL